MHYFRNPRPTQTIITYKILTENLFLENPVKNCVVGMFLTCPIVKFGLQTLMD